MDVSPAQRVQVEVRVTAARPQQAATSDQRPATSDQRPATSDQRPATSDQRPATSRGGRGVRLQLQLPCAMESEEYELDYETDDASSPHKHKAQDLRVEAPLPEEGAHALASDDDNFEEEGHDGRVEAETTGDATVRRDRIRKRPGFSAKDGAVVALTRKLKQYKKLNAELRNQLQKFYQNEAIAFLENKAQDKQRHIDSLTQENKALLTQQRLLIKQVEEMQESMESYPTKRQAMRDELRVCREQLRLYKERQKGSDERSNKLHQQAVDLANKNKHLTEKLRRLEAAATASSPTTSSALLNGTGQDIEGIIASQEDEITRLRRRVDVMKKAAKLDRTKHDKQLQAAQDETEAARVALEEFHHQLFEKEKAIRGQYLQIKTLKRSLRDVVAGMQAQQGLDFRIASQSHYSTGVMTKSPSKTSTLRIGDHTDHPRASTRRDHYDERGAVSGQLVPCPPGGTYPLKHLRGGAASSARSHLYNHALSPRSLSADTTVTHGSRNNGDESDLEGMNGIAVGITELVHRVDQSKDATDGAVSASHASEEEDELNPYATDYSDE